MGNTTGTIFWLALAAMAATGTAQTPWTKIAQSEAWAPDQTWGPGNPGNSRLASDGTKKLFLSQGNNLYVGENQGTSWKVAATGAGNSSATAAPVAAGWDGEVLWGGWVSLNGGAIWTMPDTSRKNLNTGFGFLTPSGRILAGEAHGGISMSKDEGLSWRPVFSATGTHSISGFVSFMNWSFAVLGPDRILASRNLGEDWADLASFLVPDSAATELEGPAATFLALNNKTYTYSLWSLQAAPEGGEAVVSEYSGYYHRDTLLSARRIKPALFPDSPVTAFVTTDGHRGPTPPTLWVGTWGQGIWISRDNGLTWNPRNTGIGDLHVEAICVTGGGWNRPLFALTRDGLYRLDSTLSAVTSSFPIRQSGTSPARAKSGRNGALFQPGPGAPGGDVLFRADGRKSSLRIPAIPD